MAEILNVKHLSKNYYSLEGEVKAIKDISFICNEKEFISIIGSSGCGKSTLLNIIGGLDTYNNGEIIKKNNLIIGYMLQEDALFDWLTVFENACIGLDIKNILTIENKNYVKSLLIKYGLEEFMDKYPSDLSGGMRQRVVCM